MKVEYICEITAVISNGVFTLPVSVACPVFEGQTLRHFDGNSYVNMPFLDAIAPKIKVLLSGWFSKGVSLSILLRQLPSDSVVTCESNPKSIVHDIIFTLLNQLLYGNSKC